MALKIVRNDITKMMTEAIVNTANPHVIIGNGCDRAVYNAAGAEALLSYRKEYIGEKKFGEAFITPGFDLSAKYIIHAVSPVYDSESGKSEPTLRACYQNSLKLALEYEVHSIAFPLISTGSFGYPKIEGMRIALEEIRAFLAAHEMEIYLVVFGTESTNLGKMISDKLESYIDENYVSDKLRTEYPGGPCYERRRECGNLQNIPDEKRIEKFLDKEKFLDEEKFFDEEISLSGGEVRYASPSLSLHKKGKTSAASEEKPDKKSKKTDKEKLYAAPEEGFTEELEKKLKECLEHSSDTFSEYLLYLISKKGMKNADVYNRALVDKKVFSKIKNNRDYHPEKRTALCLCVGAYLNLDETKDLLSRAGYALSPSDRTDILFQFFIENEIYDMIEIDVRLEEYGLPCILA